MLFWDRCDCNPTLIRLCRTVGDGFSQHAHLSPRACTSIFTTHVVIRLCRAVIECLYTLACTCTSTTRMHCFLISTRVG